MDPDWPGGPPPGWYPDPSGQQAWRWWDGYQWTGYASDPVGPPVAAHAAPLQGGVARPYGMFPSVEQELADELERTVWAKRVLPLYVLAIGLAILVAWGWSTTFRQIYHQIRLQMQTGTVQQINTIQPARLQLLNVAILAVEVPFFVLLLRWQFQAAKTARLLSLPAKRSPGLGVGGWFIPVVNLWFPYQAIRDCLPPGDSGRSVVARMWAFYLSTSVVVIAADILAIVGNPAGFAIAAVALALAAGFALHCGKAVELIADAHRRLLSERALPA